VDVHHRLAVEFVCGQRIVLLTMALLDRDINYFWRNKKSGFLYNREAHSTEKDLGFGLGVGDLGTMAALPD
jgi:hypothetical protein